MCSQSLHPPPHCTAPSTCQGCFSHSNLQLTFLPKQQLALCLLPLTHPVTSPIIRGLSVHPVPFNLPLSILSSKYTHQSTCYSLQIYTAVASGQLTLCAYQEQWFTVSISSSDIQARVTVCVCTCVYACVCWHICALDVFMWEYSCICS